MIKKRFRVTDMHCASCAAVIEADLEDVGAKASCSYAQQSLEVEFDETKTTEEDIKKIVQQSGYSIVGIEK